MKGISSASRRMPPSWRSSETQCHLKEIVRRTGHNRKLVRQVSRGESTDVFRTRQSTLDAHLPFPDAQWSEGCRNGAEIWRRLQGQGFQGSLRVVSEWTTRRRRGEKATNQQLQKVPSARTISRLMTTARDNLSKADTVTIAAIEARVPTLVEARTLVERFQAMVRKKLVADLDPWSATASLSLIFCEWHHQGQSRRPCRHHRALVQWPDRRADHETKARETPDVWNGEGSTFCKLG